MPHILHLLFLLAQANSCIRTVPDDGEATTAMNIATTQPTDQTMATESTTAAPQAGCEFPNLNYFYHSPTGLLTGPNFKYNDDFDCIYFNVNLIYYNVNLIYYNVNVNLIDINDGAYCSAYGDLWFFYAPTGKCYGEVDVEDTIANMPATCASTGFAGMIPASIHSEDQYLFLQTNVFVNPPIWLGLYYNAAGMLEWHDGSAVDFIRAPLDGATNPDPTRAGLGIYDDWTLSNDPSLPPPYALCQAPPL
ncbi:hypothetical protein WR25_00477 [Diploscapter pachys]|uniref:C-type lectin domain-containing protein n=1 Tax=Diploscapter pachys TaxID=2018661 RepID=A0A2A2KJD8_9BILA|nr:hypothetical protein WR25_00477 [Diploscapter pachys]